MKACLDKDNRIVAWRHSIVGQSVMSEPLFVLCVAGLIYYAMSWGVARAGNLVERKWRDHD